VIVSPLIPKGTVNSQVYDHSSVLATVEPLFGIKALTKRDKTANNLLSLLSLSTPRTDTPTVLPNPAPTLKSGLRYVAPPSADSTVDVGNLPGFLHSAMVQHAALLPESQRKELLARVQAIRTKGDAAHYFMEAEPKLRLARSKDFVRP
jgi:phospholipase C